MRFYDPDENIVYWYHGIDVHGRRETKVFASEFGDDYDAIPAYEQIYALAGPIQTYRITGDPRILRDAELTVDLFDRFYLDRNKGGYFSHLDPITLDPRSESLGANKGKKNWNSVGDHAPAYLINLYLATGEERYADMLEYTFDTIAKYFPNYERQPVRAGEVLRGLVARPHAHVAAEPRRRRPQPEDRLEPDAHVQPEAQARVRGAGAQDRRGHAGDRRRPAARRLVRRDGARRCKPGEEYYRFAFHDRKAWWQQEQGILAYLILNGVLGDDEYLRLARESSAFYNAFFLDHDDGAVYFNVLANGIPYLLGTERFKGSHSMSMYHSGELCYLAQVYTNLLITKQPLDLYFKPLPGAFKRNILRVSPDILPPGSIRIGAVVDRRRAVHATSTPTALTVKLPDTKEQVRVKVRIEPTAVAAAGAAQAEPRRRMSVAGGDRWTSTSATVDDVTVVALAGEIDGSTAPLAQAQILPLVAAGVQDRPGHDAG